MTEKFIINGNGEIEDTMAHITFDSFMEILIVLNGQSRQLKKLSDENEQLKKDNEHLETCFKMADSTYHMLLKQYQNIEIALSKYRKENEKLKKELFEARKDYLIETADISDKLYLEDEIEEERKEIFGDNND